MKKTIFIYAISILLLQTANAQTIEGDPEGIDPSLQETEREQAPEDVIVTFAEQMPKFPNDELKEFISKNIIYPPKAKKNGIEGHVILSVVISKEGKISDIEVLKGLGYELEEEAVRIVKAMPDWIPAKQNGTPVRLRMTLPVMFKLQ